LSVGWDRKTQTEQNIDDKIKLKHLPAKRESTIAMKRRSGKAENQESGEPGKWGTRKVGNQ